MRMLSLLAGMALGACAAQAQTPLRFEDFLHELTDLRRLAEAPAAGVTCRQFSSYDRASVAPDQPGWSANADAGQFLREDPEGHVLADMDGPGVIVRIWSANPAGTLRVFLDGQAQPTIEVPFQAFTESRIKPYGEPLVGRRSAGANCYMPIPYARHCRVVVKDPGPLYYHVGYRTYPAGTPIETLDAFPLQGARLAAFLEANARLARTGEDPYAGGTEVRRDTADVEAPPGAVTTLMKLAGPRAVRLLRVTFPDGLTEADLRRLLLGIRFDGQDSPSVVCPLGDFFGTAPGLNAYRSLPLSVVGREGRSYWYMPFAAAAEIGVDNRTSRTVRLALEVTTEAVANAAGLLHFHAKWRRSAPNTVFDWPLLQCTGRGRLVGTMLHVWNPTTGWWGEGDEKIWVDGETFPSFFGTGSEDYYGYAWCNPALFQHAYHNQTRCDGPGNGNHTSVNRWHVLDDVPFQKSLTLTIENYGRQQHYAAVAYWYAAAGQQDFFAPVRTEDLVVETFRVPGMMEAEQLAEKPASARPIAADRDPRTGHLLSGAGALEVPAAVESVAVPIESASVSFKRLVVRLSVPRPAVLAVSLGPREVATDRLGAGFTHWTRHVQLPKGSGRLEVRVRGADDKPMDWLLDGVVFEDPRGAGALEAEACLEHLTCPDPRLAAHGRFSQETAVRIDPGKAETFQLAVPQAGRYSLGAFFVVDRDGPTVEVNGQKVSLQADRWNVDTRTLQAGPLPAGPLKVVIRHVEGKGPAFVDRFWLAGELYEHAVEVHPLKIAERSDTDYTLGPQGMRGFGGGWSHDDQLFICFRKPGQWVVLDLPAQPGKYRVGVALTTSYDYGIIDLELNGRPLLQGRDCFTRQVLATGLIGCGEQVLQAANRLKVTVTGKNAASGGYYAGLDVIVLEPVR